MAEKTSGLRLFGDADGKMNLGLADVGGAVLVMPTSLLTAPLGVRAAHAMSKRTLETAFGCYLFIVGSRFVVSLL